MLIRFSVSKSVAALVLAIGGVASAQTTYRMSVIDGSNAEQNGPSDNWVSVSDDGNRIAFVSHDNLDPVLDGNFKWDVYVRDRAAETTFLCSYNTTSGSYGNLDSFQPMISGDGRYVVFVSNATSLLGAADTGDGNGFTDVFRHDLQTRTTVRVSNAFGGGPANADSFSCAINQDGSYVAFASDATNLVNGLVDVTGFSDVFRRNMTGVQVNQLMSRTSSGGVANSNSGWAGFVSLLALSDDGSKVAFGSLATNLNGSGSDSNSASDVFVYMPNGTVPRVSVTSTGAAGNGASYLGGMSSDGNYVGFNSQATNLVSASDGNGSTPDAFVRDMGNAVTERVDSSVSGNQANAGTTAALVSDDGQTTVFLSTATNLDPTDANGIKDIFIRQRASDGSTAQIARVKTSDGDEPAADLESAAISADARFIAFASGAVNLIAIDANNLNDTFLTDLADPRWTGIGPGLAGTFAYPPTFSATGTLVGGTTTQFLLSHAPNSSGVYLVYGLTQANAPFKGGTMIPNPDYNTYLGLSSGTGTRTVTFNWPNGLPANTQLWHQFWVVDSLGPVGFSASGCMKATTP